MKMAAGDPECDFILPRILAVAKADPRLLGGVVRALETATTDRHPVDDKDPATEKRTAQTFAEDEARSVLLYYRGIAAYTYEVAPKGTEPVSEALELWKQCRAQLAKIGGYTASLRRRRATEELAKHYFQTMVNRQDVDECKFDQIDRLKELCDTSGADLNSLDGFLGSLYALHDNKEQSKAVLGRRVRRGLGILSDDDPDNDSYGLLLIFGAMGQYQDFDNLAVALSMLGQQDIVTQELSSVAKDVTVDDAGVDRNKVLELLTKLVAETVQLVKLQVPQPAQQVERIMAAKAHIDSLVAAHNDTDNAYIDADAGVGAEVETNTETNARKVALDLVHSRLAELEQNNTPKLSAGVSGLRWSCDGRKSNGKYCDNTSSFDRDFYHCIYCPDKDFCAECLGRLRGVTSDNGSSFSHSRSTSITACSAKHRWFKIPAACSNMYVGLTAENVWRPSAIRPMRGDESVLEACYDEAGTEQVSVTAWKTELARDWGISLCDLDVQLHQDEQSKRDDDLDGFGDTDDVPAIARSTTA